jgi:hypothetical protein
MCPPERRAYWAELLQLRPWQRHSLVLAVAGFVHLVISTVYIAVPRSPASEASMVFAVSIAPIPAWGLLFWVVGLLGLASTRWPPSSKTWGYTALSALGAFWGSQYLAGVLFLDAPAQALSGSFIWLLVAFLWWAIAGLMNPDDLMPDQPFEEHAPPDHRHDER